MITKNNIFALIYHFLFAVSSSVVGAIVASWPLLFIFMLVQKTYETVHMSLFKVMHNYNELLFYLVWPFEKRLRMDNFPTSPDAAEHFAECKHLFVFTVIVFIVCLAMYFIFKKQRKKALLNLDKSVALIFLLLPIVIFPFAVTNFDSFFVVFHHILFNNSNWLFNPSTDPIINVLTEGFFASCFAVTGIIYELYFAEKLLRK
ncbi:TIGR01906 family membrane protein [Lactobacillus kefiranofaciens]|uniref:TIGR01906 family membrane protein n=1 Tax=Lactobacillus kefiranofaciens TaxID=267818 RepID=UPI002468A424|nr:TIGR01906 family membrane protein [Lactobacillus kefiranofaciens]MDH5100270.1 TIGR01906 family membrane protein [Lactobacillus kefiranofaciens]